MLGMPGTLGYGFDEHLTWRHNLAKVGHTVLGLDYGSFGRTINFQWGLRALAYS